MSTDQQSKPRAANQSIAEESTAPGTCRSKVGCEAIEEPCTNKMVPMLLAGSPAHFSHRNSFTLPSLLVQCSSPLMAILAISFIVPPIGLIAHRDLRRAILSEKFPARV